MRAETTSSVAFFKENPSRTSFVCARGNYPQEAVFENDLRMRRIKWEDQTLKKALTAVKMAEKSCMGRDLGLIFPQARAII